MIRNDFTNGLTELMNKIGATPIGVSQNNNSFPYDVNNRIRNIYFGKTSDYPSVTNNPSVIMDSKFMGTIKAYASVNTDDTEYYDVYVLSDDLMYTHINSSWMFNNLHMLNNIYFSNVDTSKTVDMNNMFNWCVNLYGIYGTEGWDTSNVTDMSNMFGNCVSLQNLNVSGFNTSKVTNMSYMFYLCRSLQNLNVSGFDTSEVTDMSYMFYNCYNLQNIDVSGFITSKVENMSRMFYYANLHNSQGTVNLDEWDVSNVTNMSYMFGGTSADRLYARNWKPSKIENFSYSYVFSACNIGYVDISGWDVSHVTDFQGMFQYCYGMKEIHLQNWDFSGTSSLYGLFSSSSGVQTIDMAGCNTSTIQNMSYMFYSCGDLVTLDCTGWDTSKVKNFSYMFGYCYDLENPGCSSFNTESATNLSYMFYYCQKLKSIDLSSWNIKKVENAAVMFDYCSAIETIDISTWNLASSPVTNINSMFAYCNALKTIYCNYDWTGNTVIRSARSVFTNDSYLPGYNGSYTGGSRCCPVPNGYFTPKS